MKRYNSVAISLHWLIAFFLLGLLAVGKYMTGLESDDPLRFTLTQWHKSFGIAVFVTVIFRILWRLTHKPPALPVSATAFERMASHATHIAMYLLMVVIPVSGWVMVSASPLNLQTELFGLITLPHLGIAANASDKELLTERSVLVHIWLANILLALAVLHIAAAFFHQLVHRDNLISRMVISDQHRRHQDMNHGIVFGLVLLVGAGLALLYQTDRASAKDTATSVIASASSVSFIATQLGEPINGTFSDVEVSLSLDELQLDTAVLTATVATASVNSGDSQIDDTLVTSNWFASDDHPQASFEATNFEKSDDGSFDVIGDLTIKGITQSISFQMVLEAGVGSGQFEIQRSDYEIGDAGQDEFADQIVKIGFSVRNSVQ